MKRVPLVQWPHRVVTISVALLLLLTSHVHAACLVDNTTDGFLLPLVITPGYGMCSKGFLCPNSDPHNMSTYPRFCPATTECLQLKLQNKMCPPQGTYEPYVCPAGSYCPTGYEKRPCPEGYYCPLGTTTPYKCSLISHCPEGSSVYYDLGAVVVLVVLDVVFVCCQFWISWRTNRIAPVTGGNTMSSSPVSDVEMDVNNGTAGSRMSYSDATATETNGPKNDSIISFSNEDLTTLSKAIALRRGSGRSLEFVFSNLSVTIPPATSAQEEKIVLRSVSGQLQPGRVTAVMGPSGAGKTVFFTALLTKLDSSWKTTGTLEINGQQPSEFERFRHVIGYVAQDDTLHDEISVYDNVWYSSEVRLPMSMTLEERDSVRRASINILNAGDLQRVRAAALSASQRKKCSIAVELASAPSALFLDEPTSALDATAALELCQSLTALARQSKLTVVMVIHQPRVEIWNGLDQVLFLAPGGYTVYQGSKDHAVQYFREGLGFEFGHGNPADIIIDGIAEHRDRCIAAWESYMVNHTINSPSTAATERGETANAPPPPPPQRDMPQLSSGTDAFPQPDQNASIWRQMWLAHQRSVQKQSTMLLTIATDVVMGMVAAAIMASAAVQVRYVGILDGAYAVLSPKHNGYLLAMLAMFYQIAVAATTSVTSLRSFMGERECYWREVATGQHNRVAYFVGTTTAEIYRLLITSFHFTIVAYFMFQPLQGFWVFFLFMFVMFVGFDSQSSMLSMILRPSSAPLLVTVAGVFISLLNGYPSIPLINNLGFTYYLTEAFIEQELVYTNNLYKEPLMNQYHVNRRSLDYGVAAGIIMVYRVIAFVLMKYTNRDKQR